MANQINLPSGWGALTRFSEEFDSKFMITPTQVIGFSVVVLLLRIFLGAFLG